MTVIPKLLLSKIQGIMVQTIGKYHHYDWVHHRKEHFVYGMYKDVVYRNNFILESRKKMMIFVQ